jgi:1-acyl-sn-glycerol-3-phosphate acyltransferase
MGWHLHRTGHVLVDRARPGAGVVKKMARLVAQGHSLIVFPEGTRSTDGSVARFKGGPFMIALQARLPVVPITLIGSRHVMFRGEVTVRPGRVTLIVHDPIETAGVSREAAREFATSVRDIVASRAA